MSAATLRISLLGDFQISFDGDAWRLNAPPMTTPLLAYLLIHRSQEVPRETLAFSLWPDDIEEVALGKLRRHLYQLQNALPESQGEKWIIVDRKVVKWNRRAGYWLDVEAFEALGQRDHRLAEAIELYRGEFMQSHDLEWISFERERLSGLQSRYLEQAMSVFAETGNRTQARAFGGKLLIRDPYREDIVVKMMRSYLTDGERKAALELYAQLEQVLVEDLDIQPLDSTQQMFRQAQTGQIVDESSSVEGTRPAIQPTPSAPNIRRDTAFPSQLRAIIGRDDLLYDLVIQLAGEDRPARITTLLGPTGAGKTRLAIELLAVIGKYHPEHFRDGIFFVALAGISSADQLPDAIATAIDLPGRPDDVTEAILEHLRHREALLVLDNMEQLLAGRDLIEQIVLTGPDVTVLVTSQAPLGLYGEHEVQVSPLRVPSDNEIEDIDALLACPSVTLFVESARLVNPAYVLNEQNAADVANIVRNLDGLPLAIELASSRVRLYSAEGILANLNNQLDFLKSKYHSTPIRHLSLRAAVTWSWSLLSQAERDFFMPLAVFNESFSLQDAAAVQAQKLTNESMLELIESFVERSMIQVEASGLTLGPRFRLLSALRLFGQEQLAELASIDVVRERQLMHYQQGLATAIGELRTERQRHGIERIGADIQNIVGLFDWIFHKSENDGLIAPTADLLISINRYWESSGALTSALRWYRAALQHENRLSLEQITRININLGWGLLRTAEFELSTTHYLASKDAAEQLGDANLLISAEISLGLLAAHQREYGKAREKFEAAIELERQKSGGELSLNQRVAMNNLAIVYRYLGDYGRSEALLLELAEHYQHQETDRTGLAAVLINMASLFEDQGDYKKELQYSREALEIRIATDDQPGLIVSLNMISSCYLHLGALEKALVVRTAALQSYARAGIQPTLENQLKLDRQFGTLREALGAARFESIRRASRKMDLESVLTLARSDAIWEE
jgi:predicted ATPase/DNA-binding SARP family transcriptional activator